MQPELFLRIAQQQKILEFIVLIIFYALYWYITFVVARLLIKNDISRKWFITSISIMFINSICGKIFIPKSIYGFEMLLLLFLLMLSTRIKDLKTNIKSLWAIAGKSMAIAIVLILLGALGDIFIIAPICILNNKAAVFFLNNGFGNSIATLCECFGPAILILFLKRKAIFPIIKNLVTKIDLIDVMGTIALYYLAYSSVMRTIHSKRLSFEMVFNVCGVIIVFFCYYIIKIRQVIKSLAEETTDETKNMIDKMTKSKDEALEVLNIICRYEERMVKENNEINSPDLLSEEIEIINFIMQGLSNPEIATKTHTSIGSIRKKISAILVKLNLENRTQIAIYGKERLHL